MPKVSAILNAYNGERYIREAIESVLRQTFSDWELVIFDNASTDQTQPIAESYHDQRIRYRRIDEPRSLGEVRSLAVREATGDWIAFIDHDDVWTPEKLERQVALTDEPHVGIVYGRSIRFGEGQTPRDFDHRHEFTVLPAGNILIDLMADGSFFTMSCAMLRRTAVDEWVDELRTIELCQDYFLFLAIAERYEARAIDEVVCYYRVHPGNISRVRAARMHREILRLIDRWGDRVDRRLYRRRQKVYQTNLAVAEIGNPGTALCGLARVCTKGSLSYLLSRPLARGGRAIRRRLCTPRWQRTAVSRKAFDVDLTRVRLIDTSVSAGRFDDVVAGLRDLVHRREGGYVSAANAYALMLARDRPDYRTMLEESAVTTADGMPLVWLQRYFGHQAERVHNDDLFFACCERYRDWRHFFVGGREGQPEQLIDNLRKRYPWMTIVGSHATPTRPVPEEDTESILRDIQESNPSVIWVGMGTPAQDEWMSGVSSRVAPPMVGVGSLFDLVCGRTRPAPAWIKRTGLQWLFRLAQEPRRLAGRYLWYNSRFALAALRQMIATRRAARRANRFFPLSSQHVADPRP